MTITIDIEINGWKAKDTALEAFHLSVESELSEAEVKMYYENLPESLKVFQEVISQQTKSVNS